MTDCSPFDAHHRRRPFDAPVANARELAFTVLDVHKRTGQFVTRLLDEYSEKSGLPERQERQAERVQEELPFRQDEPPFKNDDPPVKTDKPPVKTAKPPIRQVKPPIRQVKPPFRQVKPPFRQVKPPFRRMATEIVYGVVQRRAALDALLQPHLKRPRHRIEGRLWTLLQMGAYQLAFLSGVPPHAALHETVELAKRLRRPRWTGFLNAVLRSLSRDLTERITESPAADAVPISENNYRILRQPIFPDPRTDPAGYVSQAFSLPRWLIERWHTRFEFAELLRLGFWFNTAAPTCLRVNSLSTNRDAVLAEFADGGIAARPGTSAEAVVLEQFSPIEQLAGFDLGWFCVQDESAMSAARLLAPQPGESVLDLCAAPGTKTTHLAELMNNCGSIVAADVDAERLRLIEENSSRLGIDIIETRLIEADGRNLPPGPFDAILVDAPCSNTGVLGKRPEARWRIQPRDIEELSRLQSRLLKLAWERLKPGGGKNAETTSPRSSTTSRQSGESSRQSGESSRQSGESSRQSGESSRQSGGSSRGSGETSRHSGGRLVYSTCSIEPDENRQVVQRLLRECTDAQLEMEIDHLPGRPGDGAYQALLSRSN